MKYIILFLIIAVAAGGCLPFDAPRNPVWDYDYSRMQLVQLESPHEGQPIVTIYTAYGEIKAMLFPEYAPNTVANFIARINEGFYENKPVVALINGEIIFTGAYDEEGHQGVTDDGKLIENEHSVNLWPFKGAMLAFSGRQGFGDSRFWLIGGVPLSVENAEAMRNTVRRDETRLFPDELIEAFENNESLPGAMGIYTIFGQVFEGFDVLDEILSLPTAEDSSKPLEEILIERIVLSEYSEYRF
ncbi:MAG: peptidylprolyl isomerase [Oscillospiraceae bacterium]|jgi:peptidyl-prolyl cis-trans isomerase B (cyclophilin B)|nr:peptidylprolyl isomerase [Oscillospiraceae bacterium]